MEKIKVLYVFDQYLSRTMNWAHRQISNMPTILPYIASPIIIENEFYEKKWIYKWSPFQLKRTNSEYNVPFLQRIINYLIIRKTNIYKAILKKQIILSKPDLIHIHFGNVGADYMDIAFALKIPLVVTFHGYDYQMVFDKKPFYREKYKELFERVTAITVGGTKCKERIIQMGCPANKAFVIPQGIDLSTISFKPKKKEKNELHLFQACAISEKKGVEYSVYAFAKALKECPNMQFTIAGERFDKEIANRIDDFIYENALSDKIHFEELLPYNEFIEKMYVVDVFIQPSITAKNGNVETAPVTMMDAQATGTPCISTYHSDISELVLNESTGLLVPEKDITGIANCIKKFYEMDNDIYLKYAKNGRKHIEDNYDVSHLGRQMCELYQLISTHTLQ